MHIVVNEELKAYIDPLTAEEYEALERSVLAEGCRDALVLWGDVLVDGHNRYAICCKHGLSFQTVQNTRFQSMEDVYLWMIDQHLGRRSLSDFQRGVLALRKREIATDRRARSQAAAAPGDGESPGALDTRDALARAARLSSSQVLQIEKIQRQAVPEVVAAVKAGTISLNAAATVASLPVPEQVAAAAAGKDELKLAAKRVRESRRKPAAPDEGLAAADAAAVSQAQSSDLDQHTIETLRQRVSELVAENMVLHQQLARLKSQLASQQPAAPSDDTPPWE